MDKIAYYSGVRRDALGLLDEGIGKRVLEVGCGVGNTLAYLKETGFAAYAAGIEKHDALSTARNEKVDVLLWGDIEKMELGFDRGFDVILLLDVLEHLYEPYGLIKRLSGLLLPSGYMVVSIPNVRNYPVLKDLIVKGRWDYKDKGLLDAGHIRFFTLRSFVDGLRKEGTGLEVASVGANMENRKGLILRRLPFLREFFVCQHLLKLKRP